MKRPEVVTALRSLDDALANAGCPFVSQSRAALRFAIDKALEEPKPPTPNKVWLVTAKDVSSGGIVEIPLLFEGGLTDATDKAINYVRHLTRPLCVDSVRAIGPAVEVEP